MTNLKTRRLAGIKKETFEDLLKVAEIPVKYFCRRSFATSDVLLPSEELVVKLVGDITSKFFRLQPEHLGRRRIKITVCNVPIQIKEEVLVAFLSDYGDEEDVSKAESTNGTAHGDYLFIVCLNRGGGLCPYPIRYITRVKWWRWSLRAGDLNVGIVNSWVISRGPALKRPPKQYLHRRQQQQQQQQQQQWPQLLYRLPAEVLKEKLGTTPIKRRGDPSNSGGEAPPKTPEDEPPTKTSPAKQSSSSSSTLISLRKEKEKGKTWQKKQKNKKRNYQPAEQTEAMVTSVNLKRRRDSGDSATEKKQYKKLPIQQIEPQPKPQPQTPPQLQLVESKTKPQQ